MRWIGATALAMLLVLGGFMPARGAALGAKIVPADAKWVLHVDMEALRTTRIWEIVRAELDKNPDFVRGVGDVEALTGMRFPQDLHEITLYGRAFGGDAPVILLRAKVDQNTLVGLLTANPDYEGSKHGEHAIHSWVDKGKRMNGAFFGEDRIIIAQNKANVEAALDVLDGKAKTLDAASLLTAGAGTGILAYVAGDGLSQLKPAQANSPMVKEVESAWASIGEKDQDVVLKASATTKTAQTAEQLKAAGDGLKAMAMLAAAGEKADENIKAIAAAVQSAMLKAQDRTVSLEWRLPTTSVRTLIDTLAKNKKPAQQP